MTQYKYAGFISYAHADETMAGRLHHALETFKIPRDLSLNVDKKLHPIFRDTTELTAHHSLSEKIRDAVNSSQFLIVVCSPSAKSSHWVNEEIRLFRSLHGEASILCVLIEGTPDTSFPPSLLEGGREPLAANLGASRDSFRLGVTQLAASMLGVGLDDLIQRERQRIRQRMTAVTLLSLMGMLIMSVLTWNAMDARHEADKRRNDAEGQIEFMITDLKDELESVGRLDALQAVGDRAATYYDGYDVADHDDDALGRRARVFHQLGEIQRNLGNFVAADAYFKSAYDSTKTLVNRSPQNTQRVFEHGQSVFWVGYNFFSRENYEEAQIYFDEYLESAMQLNALEPDSERTLQELGYAHTNLGSVALDNGKYEIALDHYENAMNFKQGLLLQKPKDKKRLIAVANAYVHIADMHDSRDYLDGAIKSQLNALELISSFPFAKKDAGLNLRKLKILRSLARGYYLQSDFVKAREVLDSARGVSHQLVKIETSNTTINYEIVLLDILEFEIAYLEDKIEDARRIYRDIELSLLEFPADFHESFRFRVLRNTTDLLPLYLAIEAGDVTETQVQGRKNLKHLQSEGTLTSVDILNRPGGLRTLAFVDKVLGTQDTADFLDEICNDQTISLNYNRKAILASHTPISQCPNAKSETSFGPSAFGRAMELLEHTINPKIDHNGE